MGVHTEHHKLHLPQKRQLLILLPFAMFYTVAAMLGQLEKAESLGIVHNLGRAGGWFLGSYAVLVVLCMAISQRDAIMQYIPFLRGLPEQKERDGKWYLYLLFTGICLLCYLPYYLMYYPGWLSNDVVWQIEQILGWAPPSNHHPYFHTLIMKVLFTAGCRLSGTYTGGAAFYTFCQMLVMAMVYGFFLYWLYRRGSRVLWLVLATVFYTLLPINGLMTIFMGKDMIFTAVLLLFAWMTAAFDLDVDREADTEVELDGRADREVETDKDADSRKGPGRSCLRWGAYFAAGVLLCLLRSNGIFIFLGTAFVLIPVRMWRRKFPVRTFACVCGVLVCFLLYRGPVLGALHVEPPDTIEGLTMPTQHLLCAYLKGGSLTEEEIAMIDRVVPVEQVGEYYNPWFFDIVKNFIREAGDQQVIADNKWEYFKLWLRVGLRNPLQYMVAEVRQTCGYWAFTRRDYEYVYGEYFMVDNPFGITTQRKFFTYDDELAMHDFLMDFQDLYNRVWRLGLNTWVMVFGLAYLAYVRRGRHVLIYIPFIMMLGSLLLATPVSNEFRYAYGLFAAFPVLFGYTFRCREGV